MGTIQKIERGERRFRMDVIVPSELCERMSIGSSVNIDGTCLTVREAQKEVISVDIITETVRVTTAGEWQEGRRVNLEAPLRAGDDISGHFVLGHIDGVGVVRTIIRDADEARMFIEPPVDLLRFLPYKGSVAVNGVSLTIANIDPVEERFIVGLVPYTLTHTNLGMLAHGDHVNLEVDMFARYFDRLLEERLRAFEREN